MELATKASNNIESSTDNQLYEALRQFQEDLRNLGILHKVEDRGFVLPAGVSGARAFATIFCSLLYNNQINTNFVYDKQMPIKNGSSIYAKFKYYDWIVPVVIKCVHYVDHGLHQTVFVSINISTLFAKTES